MANKNYDNLTFSDDFLFCRVLQTNPDLCRELLELILGKEIGALVAVDGQRPIEITPNGRGVRFDVYAKDDDSVIYDIEMQNAPADNLPKRARYAHSLIDLDMLERGAHYRDLRQSYVIFICRFNLMKDAGRHCYSFRNLCIEDHSLELNDGTEKLFLCTKGTADDVSPEMRDFLAYVDGSAPEGDLPNRLEDAVTKARQDPRYRKEYMDFQDYLDMAKEEGRQEGRAEFEREKARADAETARADEAEAKLAEALKMIEELKTAL